MSKATCTVEEWAHLYHAAGFDVQPFAAASRYPVGRRIPAGQPLEGDLLLPASAGLGLVWPRAFALRLTAAPPLNAFAAVRARFEEAVGDLAGVPQIAAAHNRWYLLTLPRGMNATPIAKVSEFCLSTTEPTVSSALLAPPTYTCAVEDDGALDRLRWIDSEVLTPAYISDHARLQEWLLDHGLVTGRAA